MEEQIIINKTEKPSSYEFGKAGNRFKLYFDTAEDLKNQIDELRKAGLYSDDEDLKDKKTKLNQLMVKK